MSHLPDDLDEWPNDPAEVLGVGMDATDKDLRRAYFRLIRKFTPDDHPAHFQKIRECYDIMKSGWGGFMVEHYMDDAPYDFDSQVHGESESSESNDVESFETDSDGQGQRSKAEHARSTIFPDVLSLSDEGRFEDAVVKTNQLLAESGHVVHEKIELSFLLYYLYLITAPSQSRSKRVELLLQLIEHGQYRSAALMRIKGELLRFPEIAESQIYSDALVQTKDSDTLSALYRYRWNALKFENYQTIIRDAQSLNQRGIEIGESELMSLMQESVEYVVWRIDQEEAKQHYQQCYERACQFRGNGYHEFEQADSMELCHEIAREWRLLKRREQGSIGQCVAKIVPYARTADELELLDIWHQSSRLVPLEPQENLAPLDEMFVTYPLAMSVFDYGINQILFELDSATEDELDENEVNRLVLAFFQNHNSNEYSSMRKSIGIFCFENAIPIHLFGRIADELILESDHDYEHSLSYHISKDSPLQCAVSMALLNA